MEHITENAKKIMTLIKVQIAYLENLKKAEEIKPWKKARITKLVNSHEDIRKRVWALHERIRLIAE